MCFPFFLDNYFLRSSKKNCFVSWCPHHGHLEAEDLVLELADRPGLGVSERLGGLLHGADHGRRAADENLDIGSRSRETFLLYGVSQQALDCSDMFASNLP